MKKKLLLLTTFAMFAGSAQAGWMDWFNTKASAVKTQCVSAYNNVKSKATMLDPRTWNFSNLKASEGKSMKDLAVEADQAKRAFEKTEAFKCLSGELLQKNYVSDNLTRNEYMKLAEVAQSAQAREYLRTQKALSNAPYQSNTDKATWMKRGKVAFGGATVLAGLGLFGHQVYSFVKNFKKEGLKAKLGRFGKMALAGLITVGGVGVMGHTLQNQKTVS